VTNHPSSNPLPPTSPRDAVNAWGADYIDGLYEQWRVDPNSVDAAWQQFFKGFELGVEAPAKRRGSAGTGAAAPAATATTPGAGAASPAVRAADAGVASAAALELQRKVDELIARYRAFGHLAAQLDPLGTERPFPQVLTLESVGLDDSHLSMRVDPGSLRIAAPATLGDVIGALEETYCRHIGAEYQHITDPERRRWLQERIEARRTEPRPGLDAQRHILGELAKADTFESFLAMRYVGKKRFGAEGAESLIPMLDAVIDQGAALGAREFCLGMAHRGRMNVLAHIVGKDYERFFTEFEEAWAPDFADGGGDVKYHCGFSAERQTSSGAVKVSLPSNPSHLEFINGVVLGSVRAKQTLRSDEDRREVVPVLMHGDAAFSGQGTQAECFNFMKLRGYDTGGCVHIVTNNQVGFTTDPVDLFTGNYCTDVAKGYDCPIFHVNGDDPEACVWVAKLAIEFRQAFGHDVIVDLVCFRKHGHNEADEPSYTQPLMYARVRKQKPAFASYRDRLVAEGAITADEASAMVASLKDSLDRAQTAAKATPVEPSIPPFQGRWSGLGFAYDSGTPDTGVARGTLATIASSLGSLPGDFAAHRTIAKAVQGRGTQAEAGSKVEWATAELLAYGTLLKEGHTIRITGEDVQRGTFSHRHAVVRCQNTGEAWCALRTMGAFEIVNSPLTESSTMAYEYGYSLVDPNALVIWEAQFGDFANGGQVIIDQFIAGGEIKWRRSSALVLFLPHGQEGQGPEHSSARLERFLQLSSEDNMEICAPTTSAQVFHMIRRHLKRTHRKPLIVMTPKSMLRLPAAQSTIEELASGRFQRVIDDPRAADFGPAQRVIFCMGKVFWEMMAHREAAGDRSTLFVRLEQMSPFPAPEIEAILQKYRGAEFCWVQEETRNSGAFRYVQAQMIDRFGVNPRYIGRPDCASPATGSAHMHEAMAKALGAMVFPSLDPRAKSGAGAHKADVPAAGAGTQTAASKPDAAVQAVAEVPAAEAKASGRGRRSAKGAKGDGSGADSSDAGSEGAESAAGTGATGTPAASEDADTPDLFASRPSRSRG
jgi:2-oxoglutarate dehydrogenase E1 component